MFIRDILKSKETVISFEVFPPKKDSDYDTVSKTIVELTNMKPDFISVTYGAGGGTSKNTLKICKEVQQYETTALAHLTCVSATKQDIVKIAEEFKTNKIENILALRGDMPKELDAPVCNEYGYANELVTHLKSLGNFCIGGACYPEGHLESKSLDDDINNIKYKVDAGCEFLITQLYFDNNYLYDYIDRLHKKGIYIPIIAGLMPVQNASQIARMSKLSGASIPIKFQKMIDKYENNSAALRQAGQAYVIDQIIDLYANGIKGIHIYTMNKPNVAHEIIKNISNIKG